MSELRDRIVFGSEEAKKIVEADRHLAQVKEENIPSIEKQEEKIKLQEQIVEEYYDALEHAQEELSRATEDLIELRNELADLESGAMYG